MLDEGVLNVSLLFQETEKGIDIDLGYDTMWHLIKEMLKDYDVTIEAKEIVGSYCPGSYDLSIRDQKFAGISQRRIRGVAVQIYLCATGSGSERAALVRDFYNLAIQGEETRFTYPEIVPSTILHLRITWRNHYSTRFNDASFKNIAAIRSKVNTISINNR